MQICLVGEWLKARTLPPAKISDKIKLLKSLPIGKVVKTSGMKETKI